MCGHVCVFLGEKDSSQALATAREDINRPLRGVCVGICQNRATIKWLRFSFKTNQQKVQHSHVVKSLPSLAAWIADPFEGEHLSSGLDLNCPKFAPIRSPSHIYDRSWLIKDKCTGDPRHPKRVEALHASLCWINGRLFFSKPAFPAPIPCRTRIAQRRVDGRSANACSRHQSFQQAVQLCQST